MRSDYDMDMVVHDDRSVEFKADTVEASQGREDPVALLRAQQRLGAMEPPGHEVDCAVKPPVRQPTAVDSERHPPKVAASGKMIGIALSICVPEKRIGSRGMQDRRT